ncbi:uncharacterized protein LOC117898964 isoform X2 [Drosophila subobscura]|uniref:uncharacterized protein LOC117898964 isoform X2 n=1 Tax=Drosophila subobscura TaxID=7241 RepID=UPI00155A427C|nr:uncharacterized protein LOC117898964 isoform X2 [Drosophila subobscura]
MDKSRSSAYEKFTGFVDQLRNTECSQKQKITCFQQIAECIMSPSLAGHINYAAHCGTATNVLLLFCEDLDSQTRVSAEENLNKIFRALEKTRVSRILMDLYGEIKRNGNQRSLRICLNLFSYYAPHIKEKHIKWYAVRLLQCMSTISQRKETLLQETLCDFVKNFGRYVQQGLSDSESCKLLETFLGNIGADCAVKRRCSAQNCISLIEHARHKSLMARHGLNKVMELLLADQQSNCVLGALGLLRLLLPQLIRGYSTDNYDDAESLAGQQQKQQQHQATTSDCRQIIEIYDYCLHLLSTQPTTNHAIINATLEVINGILQSLDARAPRAGVAESQQQSLGQSLCQLLCNQQLQHNEYLRRRKSLKNQIFQLKNYEVATSQQEEEHHRQQPKQLKDQQNAETAMQMEKNSNAKLQHQSQSQFQPKCQQQEELQQQQQQQQRRHHQSSLGINAGEDATTEAASSVADEAAEKATRCHIRNAARSISECVASSSLDEQQQQQGAVAVADDDDDDDDDDDMELLSAECDDFTTLSQLNEQQQAMSAAFKLSATTASVGGASAAAAASAEGIDKLIDVDADVRGMPKPQQHQSSLQNLLAGGDDKSQHLSDIDNESFNSIDFEAEITIAGSKEQQKEQEQQQPPEGTPSENAIESGDATTIGTFFNNLLSHSNAASESVSKLFRQSSVGSKSTPSKSAPADKSDAVSTASLTLSLSSLASSSIADENDGNVNAETQQTNFNLLWDFFDYRIFGSMSVTLRNLFRASSTIVPPLADLDALALVGGHSLSSAAAVCPEVVGTSKLCPTSGMASASASATASGAAASAATAYFDGTAEGHVFALPMPRQIAQEEKVLAKVLYRMTNKLMTLNDKNLQFGIIYALRLLLRHFNFVDYQGAWLEFNFIEICISYAYYNNATAADLSCQNDLIDVMGKLVAGAMLSSGELKASHLDFLLRHSIKMLNIYYHLVTNQRPPSQPQSTGGLGGGGSSSKTTKSELFSLSSSGGGGGGGGSRDPAVLQALGYFGGDYVYMKLYNILRGANDSYKITINHEAGSLLICLLKTCLNALGLCLEARPTAAPPEIKLIEEILHYLTKLINYAPAECVACLRQLLKYLFAQNYGSQVGVQQPATNGHHSTFIRPYFAAKGRGHGAVSTFWPTINSKPAAGAAAAGGGAGAGAGPRDTTQPLIDASPLQALGMLFVQGLQPTTPPSGDCVRLIKLFEPLVIYCLTLFMKSNALIQAPILSLLSQLLELNVTYSILDSKNVIFEQILSNLDLIESGIDRNAFIIVPTMLRFLVQLTHKSDRPLITIPKIISITNNLLANSAVRDVALLALKTLSYELFFMHSQLEEALDSESNNSVRAGCQSPLTAAPTPETREALLAQRRELDTQREVVLGMLEKFVESRPSQQVLALLLLYERSLQQLESASYRSAQDADAVYGLLCRALCSRHWRLHSAGDLRLLESCFRNNGNHVLADSKGFLQLLQLFIEQDVGNFGDLAMAMVMLANVILKTEEIYLVNHIKLYLKNNPTAERRLQAAAVAAAAGAGVGVGASPSAAILQWQDEAPSTSSAAAAARAAAASAASSSRSAISEINYFAKVLSEKLLACLDVLLGIGSSTAPPSSGMAGHAYCQLAGRFVNALHNVCCRSRHKDALQSVFRLVLAESEFLCKYYNLLLMSAAGLGGSASLEPVLLACLKLALAMRLEEPLVLLEQAAHLPLKWNLQRAVLREVCRANVARDWSPQQVRCLFAGKYLNFLIADHLEFLCELCQVRRECGSLLQLLLLRNAHRLNRPSIRIVLRLLARLCETAVEEQDASGDAGGDAAPTLQALQLLSRLHQLHDGERTQQLPMERLARRLTAQSGPAARRIIYEQLLDGDLAGGEDQDAMRTLLLKDLECRQDNETATATSSRIIDESWLFAQLIKFATQHEDAPQQQKQLMLLLLEIQSEPKLNRLLRSLGPEQEARLLRHSLAGSLFAMLSVFRQKCIHHAPHINYMQPPPLARVSCTLLMGRVANTRPTCPVAPPTAEQLDVARAVATLMDCIRSIEHTALIYIDARVMARFVGEHLLLQEQVPLLLEYLKWLARAAKQILRKPTRQEMEQDALGVLMSTMDSLLQQPCVWRDLNASTDAALRCELLEVLVHAARCMLQETIFYQRHRLTETKAPAPQAIFLAKLIETQIDIESLDSGRVLAVGCEDARLQFAGHELAPVQVPLTLLASIGIALLRTHQFYAYAVTPNELIQHPEDSQQKQQLQKQQADGKLPTIPVDSLSDVDILRQFVKRLSIFGYTTRQQFEEYFMTFLLLINKVYDEHMVDQQEQFQIKQVCLQAIMELLMTYKTFPIVGQPATGQFHHTTRWQRITCDSISLKKLHKVQLLVDACNVFYHANLERQLARDNVIGTRNFAANQYDLNFSWAQMEAYVGGLPPAGGDSDPLGGTSMADIKASSSSADADVPDIAMRNYRHFTQLSGIDFRSSTQLVFDVLQQMIELNHILVLPNLVKFCEICESRDQVKWIKERALRLQEQVAMDDTISHQHIIYLLCRSQALLIPSLGELQTLCALIGNVYLKSTHCFIRIATLQGLICLLECCSKTNTAMGKLSEELALLRALIVGYINRHGIIDESPLQLSDEHTKLVWTLNYSLIEWTSKFVPQCHLLSNTIIAANNFLKTTNNEELYLCVLHGLERMVVNSGMPSTAAATLPTPSEAIGRGGGKAGAGAGGGGAPVGAGAAVAIEAGVGVVVTPQMRHKIEKLALELLKMENEKFSIPALKLLLSCMYMGSAAQLENTELSNGIVQDDPEIIAQQNDKVDILLHCIKSSTRDAAWIYGQVLCQIIRDLVPPNEILTKVIKEFLAINQPHGDVIAMIVYQVFRSAIDSSYLQMLQDWLICTLPTFLAQPEQQGVWGLSVIFLSASINLHLIKLFPLVLGIGAGNSSSPTATVSTAGTGTAVGTRAESGSSTAPRKLGQHEIALFVTAAQDFHAKLSGEQRQRFREAFSSFEQSQVYGRMLQRL